MDSLYFFGRKTRPCPNNKQREGRYSWYKECEYGEIFRVKHFVKVIF